MNTEPFHRVRVSTSLLCGCCTAGMKVLISVKFISMPEENEVCHYEALPHQNIYLDGYSRVWVVLDHALSVKAKAAQPMHGSILCWQPSSKHPEKKTLEKRASQHCSQPIEMLLISSDQQNSLHEFQPCIQGNLIICYPRSICLLISFSLSWGRNLPVLHSVPVLGRKQGDT